MVSAWGIQLESRVFIIPFMIRELKKLMQDSLRHCSSNAFQRLERLPEQIDCAAHWVVERWREPEQHDALLNARLMGTQEEPKQNAPLELGRLYVCENFSLIDHSPKPIFFPYFEYLSIIISPIRLGLRLFQFQFSYL